MNYSNICFKRSNHQSRSLFCGLFQLYSFGTHDEPEFDEQPTYLFSAASLNDILFLLRALQPPNWSAQWHCGIRVVSSNKLVGFIAAVPAELIVYEA